TAELKVDIADVNQLTGQDYRIEYTGTGATGYTIARLPEGKPFDLPADGVVDGVHFDLSTGTAEVGDSWLVQPTRDAAAGLSLAIDDPAKIAAAAPNTGSANGDVALELAQLQSGKVLGNGAMSLNEAFSQIVNKV